MSVVWIARHAEDRAAVLGRFGDEGLTERGREQARGLGARLREAPLRLCLCSPLTRALETARIVVEGRGVALELCEALAEGSPGALAGLQGRRAAELYPDHFTRGSTLVARVAARGATAPGGETRHALLARARAAADRIAVELRDERPDGVLVVTHGGLVNYLLQILLGVPPRDEVPFGFDHCGVARLLWYRESPAFGPFAMLRFGAEGGGAVP